MMEIIIQVLAAAVGTIAFSVLFSVPKRYYGFCGICGGAGWLVYALLVPSLSVPVATFFATVLVIFLTTGIFPLVPGVGLYWTTYYTVTEQMDLALANGVLALQSAVAIVLGIVVVFELPQRFFRGVIK